jgi:hypothetical protein
MHKLKMTNLMKSSIPKLNRNDQRRADLFNFYMDSAFKINLTFIPLVRQIPTSLEIIKAEYNYKESKGATKQNLKSLQQCFDFIKLSSNVIIKDTNSHELISAIMNKYLDLHDNYRENLVNLLHPNSTQIFFLILEKSTKIKNIGANTAREWSKLATNPSDINDLRVGNLFTKVDSSLQSKIVSLFSEWKSNIRESDTLLNILRQAYVEQNPNEDATNDKLYKFDPLQDEQLRDRFVEHHGRIIEKFRRCESETVPSKVAVQIEIFRLEFQNYIDFIKRVDNHGILAPFQLMKYHMDSISPSISTIETNIGKRTLTVQPQDLGLKLELYLLACYNLQRIGTTKFALKTLYQSGLNTSEVAYFMMPIRRLDSDYAEDFDFRINAVHPKSDYKKLQMFSFSLLECGLIIRSLTSGRVKRVSLMEQVRIRRIWGAMSDRLNKSKTGDLNSENNSYLTKGDVTFISECLAAQTKIDPSASYFDRVSLRPGEKIAGRELFGEITVIYIEPHKINGNSLGTSSNWPRDKVYVEFSGLVPLIFQAEIGYLQNTVILNRYDKLHTRLSRSQKIVQFVFKHIFKLPVMVEYGVAAFMYEVVTDELVDAGLEKFGVTNPLASTLLASLAGVEFKNPYAKTRAIADPFAKTTGIANVPVFIIPRMVGVQNLSQRLDLAMSEVPLAASRGAMEKLSDFRVGGLAKLSKSTRALVDKGKGWVSPPVVGGSSKFEPAMSFVGGSSSSNQPFRLSDLQQSSTHYRLKTNVLQPTLPGGRGVRGSPRDWKRLADPRDHAKLRSYLEVLEEGDATIVRNRLSEIEVEVHRGVVTAKVARSKITAVLNTVKMHTSETYTDGVILGLDLRVINSKFSGYVYHSDTAIPSRRNGVPMLDKAYEFRNPKTGDFIYLLVEVKFGEKTRLGRTNATRAVIAKENIKLVVVDGTVKQASGAWYWQKIVEIFNSGPEGKALARKLLKAGKRGKLQTAIAKFSADMDPVVTFDEGEVGRFLSAKQLP